MPITRIIIKNYKSIKNCDISLSDLSLLIGENGTGKTSILEAINYFYQNLTESNASMAVFDENNRYSNEVRIALVYDLSEFVKISKSNADLMSEVFQEQAGEKAQKYNGYYKTILSIAGSAKEQKICVEMSQIKGRGIRWSSSYEKRLIFKSLFPIYYIDTRMLDVTEWGYIWDMLGELAKVSNTQRKIIQNKINSILLDTEQETSRKLKVITDIFNDADVSVKSARSRDFAKNVAKVYFAGENIHQRGRQLGYYSAGTNSVKYIELLLKSIDAISRTKMKEPMVLFDEPEIGLHTAYLDELADTMLDVNPRLEIIVSTHSPRLTKNILVGSETASLYNVKLEGRYSTVYKMKKFPQYSPPSKYRVTDEHINSYFSRAVLFVEGETELELFSNPYLKLLFPELKKVDVFEAISQKPLLNIMNPSLARSQIPYLCLIDADKAIEYNQAKNCFSLKKEYFPENRKELFQYRTKHQSEPSLLFQRKRLTAMAEKLRVHYYKPFFSCRDTYYQAFISAVQQYLLRYHVFCLSTTIEGTLINSYNTYFSLEFLKKHSKKEYFSAFKTYWESLMNTDRINVLRLLFNGKTDLLKKWGKLDLSPDEKLILERVMIGSKTSGWVSEYLDEFFRTTSRIPCTFSEKAFRRYLESEENRKRMTKLFQNNFLELYSLIDRLCGMINETVEQYTDSNT